jgi:hypothetical protein
MEAFLQEWLVLPQARGGQAQRQQDEQSNSLAHKVPRLYDVSADLEISLIDLPIYLFGN